MDLESLRKLYPDSSIDTAASSDSNKLSLPYQNQWLVIDKAQLSQREISALSLLLPRPKIETNPWAQFLKGQTQQAPQAEGTLFFLQLQAMSFDNQQEEHDFCTTLSETFLGNLALFKSENQIYTLVQEKKKESPLSAEEILGILEVMADDFSLQLKGFIGGNWSISIDLPRIYQEEAQLFQKHLAHTGDTTTLLYTLAEAYLEKLVENGIQNSSIAGEIKKRLAEQPEEKQLIQTMWKTKGNHSETAKQLFIHRNTLQYRIQRFYEETGFSLREMEDLTLCYLLANSSFDRSAHN